MKIYSLRGFYLSENTYILSAGEGLVVIDPGAHPDFLDDAFAFLGEKCRYVLLTHAHFDHDCSVAYLQQKGAKVICHKNHNDVIEKCSMINFGSYPGLNLPYTTDIVIEDDETLSLCGIDIQAIYTPGHSADGVCYLAGKHLFCGDTLFKLGYGATHFPTGDFYTLKKSIYRLINELDSKTLVYDGHSKPKGEIQNGNRHFLLCEHSTTIEYETENNPIFYED